MNNLKTFSSITEELKSILEKQRKIHEIIIEMMPNFYVKKQEKIKFTPEQIDHICYQIGAWYLMIKPLLEGQHNLGCMKEKLKTMICGEEKENQNEI